MLRITKRLGVRRLTALVMIALLSGCAAGPRAMHDGADLQHLENDEQRLWSMSDEADVTLQKSGAIFVDPDANAYLQSLAATLFPEFEEHIQVHILRNVEANAFAMANGSVYINTGMLARLRNEAELAAILGHEGVHFTHKHVVGNIRTAKRWNIFANVVGLGGSFFAASSMSNLSLAQEAEADAIGMSRMAASGYSPQAAAAPFKRLANELRARRIQPSTLFRSHPMLDTRAASLTSLAADLPDGSLHAERFTARLSQVRLAALEQAVQGGYGDLLVFLLTDREHRESFGAAGHYYLGEGFRLRARAGDRRRAMRAYRQAIRRNPSDYRPHGKLGYLSMQTGNNEQAIMHFETYLANTSAAADSAFVRSYLSQLRDGQPQ